MAQTQGSASLNGNISEYNINTIDRMRNLLEEENNKRYTRKQTERNRFRVFLFSTLRCKPIISALFTPEIGFFYFEILWFKHYNKYIIMHLCKIFSTYQNYT